MSLSLFAPFAPFFASLRAPLLLRELTGRNLIQTWDVLKMREQQTVVRYITLIQSYVAAVSPAALSPYKGNGSRAFWQWLKAERKDPDFDRQALARELGFPSAARFHRAFYFVTGMTPREFENKTIRLAVEAPTELEQFTASFTPKEEEHIIQLARLIIPLQPIPEQPNVQLIQPPSTGT